MYAMILIAALGADSFPVREAAETWLYRTARTRADVCAIANGTDDPEVRQRAFSTLRAVTVRELDTFAAQHGGYFNPTSSACIWPGAYSERPELYPEFRCMVQGEWIEAGPDEACGKWVVTSIEDHKAHCRRMLIAYVMRTGDTLLPRYQLEHRSWPPTTFVPFR